MTDTVRVPRDTGPNFSDSTLPEEMIYAGIAVFDQVDADNANYVAGETTDWDQGMIVVAIYRAMLAASPQGEGDCVCVRRGDGPEGCGLCNETGVATHPASPQGEGSSADAHPPQPDTPGWRDIATAPRDGSLVLCFYPDRHGHDRYSLRYWAVGDWGGPLGGVERPIPPASEDRANPLATPPTPAIC